MVSKSKTPFNWNILTYIGIGILGLIIVFAIVKIVQDIFNNPFMLGLEHITGNLVYDAGELLNGCSSQTDCNSIDDSDVCTKRQDCAYDKNKKKCIIITGETAGQSNILTLPCFLGAGLVVFAVAWLLTKVINLLRTPFKNMSDGLKQLSTLTTKEPGELTDEIKDNTKDDLAEFKEDFKTVNKREMTDTEVKFATSDLAGIQMANKIHTEINKIQDTAQKQIEMKRFDKVVVDMEQKITEVGKDGQLSDKEMAEMHIIAETVRPPLLGVRSFSFKK